jgi:NitT/TauT family transport system substrate-binding protein
MLQRLTLALALLLPLHVVQAAPLETVSVAVGNSLPATLFFVAEEQGYFTREGLKLQLQPCQGAFRCMEEMLQGRAQFSSAGDLAIMFNSTQRRDFVVLATLSSSTSILKLLTRKSLHLHQPQDFIGKKAGMVPHSATHFYLDHFLLSGGIDPQQVEHIALDQGELQKALADGRVSLIATYEPLATVQRHALGKDAQDLQAPDYALGTRLVALRNTVQHAPDLTAKLLRALDAAAQFVSRDPATAKATLARRGGLEPALIDTIWAGSQFRPAIDASLLISLNGTARWARNENLVTEEQLPDFASLLYPASIEHARQTGGKP